MLEFVAFHRSLEHSWWRSVTDVLSALASVRSHAASAVNLVSSLASAPFLKLDVSCEALCAMPDPIDVSLFEEHAPYIGIRRLSGLKMTCVLCAIASAATSRLPPCYLAGCMPPLACFMGPLLTTSC